jgi:hypothetical protein
MATIFLMVGLPGSGKTTAARQLERERPALRFGEDDWVLPLYGDAGIHDDAKREAIKGLQWRLAVQAAHLGLDVVLDWGAWSRSERDELRARAIADGVDLKLIYLDVSRDELVRRLTARNIALPPNTFHVTPEMLDEYRAVFEPPSADELK